MIRLQFDRKFIPLVAPFAGKRDIRYRLNGIRIEAAGDRPGVYIIGCDGHRLTVAYDKHGFIEGDEGRGLIVRADSQFISACKAQSSAALKVIAQGKRVSVGVDFDQEHSGLENYVMPGDPWIIGNYPDWRRVLPCWESLKPGCVALLSTNYLSDYLRLNTSVSRQNSIIFWQEKPNAAVVVQHKAHPELLSILMPRRFDDREFDFFRAKLTELAAGKQKEAA